MRTVATWILSGLVALAFIAAGIGKLTSAPMMVAQFSLFGFPLWFMYLTGILEIVGAALILTPRVAFVGAALLSCVMVGALVSHLTHGQAGMIAAPLVLLVLALAVGTLRGWGRAPLPSLSRAA